MLRQLRSVALAAAMLGGTASSTLAINVTPEQAQKVCADVTPSLVAVQYVWQNELGRRELIGAGIVVGEDGLVMSPLPMFGAQIPDEQMKEFKIIVPRGNDDPDELDAVFQGRDERTNTAFIRTKEPQKWKALKFEDVQLKIGEPVMSIGMLPKGANYKSYYMEGGVAAVLRGEVPQVLVNGGGLAAMGSPVLNVEGKAIGMVSFSPGQSVLLDDPQNNLPAIVNPPRFFTPAKDFMLSLKDPPTPEKQIVLPWMGIPRATGLNKDVAAFYGLENQPAVQINDLIPDAPAAKGGLKQGDIIVKLNGQPLERGDEPSELWPIFTRNLMRMKPGDTVKLSVLRGEKGTPLQDLDITLGTQPRRSNLAKRFYADDLGFAVRDMVFYDKYNMHLPDDQKGVLVALLRPQAAAQTGGLRNNDLITRLDNEPVTDVDQFHKAYDNLRKEKPKQAIVMEVRRGDREDTVRIEPPQ